MIRYSMCELVILANRLVLGILGTDEKDMIVISENNGNPCNCKNIYVEVKHFCNQMPNAFLGLSNYSTPAHKWRFIAKLANPFV